MRASDPSLRMANQAAGLWVLLMGVSLLWMNDYQVLILGTVAISAMAGVGMNVLLGLSGQISLGHAAFYAIGAYASTLIAMKLELNFYGASVLASLIAGLFGMLLALPALRLRGPYLAMVSIAFGYFIEQGIANWKDLTGGWNGLSGIPTPLSWDGTPMGASGITALAAVLGAAMVVGFAHFRLSRWGMLMRAAKDAEIAAESLGIRLVWIRVLAFTVSCAITGLAGSLFASLQGFISPESFPFFQSIIFLLVVLVGGRGHPVGPLLGALVVVGLPETIAFLAQYRLMFFGLALMLVLWMAPHGFMGLLHEAWAKRQGRKSQPSEVTATPQGTPVQPPFTGVSERGQSSAHAVHDLKIQGLGIRFGGNAALSDVDIGFVPGRVISLIGPNGAGKTTLINVVGGFYRASQGRVSLGGQDITSMPTHALARWGIARTFQTSQLFNDMTVLENVCVATYVGRMFSASDPTDEKGTMDRQAHAWALLKWVGYEGDPQAKAGSLAHVDRRLVEIARSLATQPQFLFLDEPAAGLSKEESQRLGVLLREIAGLGTGVILVEHDMSLVMEVSDQIHVLESGRLIASGSSAEIFSNEKVKQAYLGSLSLDTKKTHASVQRGQDTSSVSLLSKTQSQAQPAWLSVQHLSAHHGAAAAIEDLSFNIQGGQCIAVLGANGAGKSTLMRSIAGLHSQKTGEIIWGETNIAALSADQIVRLGLTLIPEGRQVFTELTVEENIALGAYSTDPLTAPELEQLYQLFPALRGLKHRKAGSLSGGEQQMLAFARGLAARPTLLMLDEPSLGLAPVIVEQLFERMSDLKQQGLTLLLVDQMAGLAMSLADQVHLLQSGQLKFNGTPQSLLDSGLLEQSYLHEHETSTASPSI